MAPFLKVDSVQISPPQLYHARTWAQRLGKQADENSLVALADKVVWGVMVSPLIYIGSKVSELGKGR